MSHKIKMNYYFNRLKSDKSTFFTLILLTLLMILNIFILNAQGPVRYDIIHSTFLVAHTEGHLISKVIFWILPVYLLLTACSWSATDSRIGYNQILIIRFEKKKYLRLNILFSFINGFFIMLIPLIINLIFAAIINRNGKESPISMENEDTRENMLRVFEILGDSYKSEIYHPWISLFLHIFVTALFVGILGVFICCLGFVIPKLRYLTFICVLMWFVAITGGYSVLNVFQPFTEYSPPSRLILFGIYSGILIIVSYVLYRYKLYVDEL